MADFSGDLIDHMIEGIGPGSAWLNDTHLDPANTTPLFGGALGLQYHIAMDGDPGYMIVPEAIPQDQAQRIAEGIHEGLQPTESFDNRFVYQVTPLAHEMIFNFTKNHISKLQEFTAPTPVPQKPWAAGLGIFRSKEPHPIPKVALKNMVFVTIALTQLNASNGWYTLLEASHLQLPPVSESDWRKVDKELAPGDVIIWRGDLAVLESGGGGGKFINLTYDVQRE